MQIVVKAHPQQKQAFLAKGIPADVSVIWLTDEKNVPEADGYFDLCFEEDEPAFTSVTEHPVFINSVIQTSESLPDNFIRMNAWNGFLEGPSIEVVIKNQHQNVIPILDTLGWKYQTVPDIPGMIAPRVIAMVINEAYFGLGEEISSKIAIDTAMKLGTNYPLGPFEWSEKIGLKKIYALLKKLSELDSRYTVAPTLEKELITQ